MKIFVDWIGRLGDQNLGSEQICVPLNRLKWIENDFWSKKAMFDENTNLLSVNVKKGTKMLRSEIKFRQTKNTNQHISFRNTFPPK